MLVIQISGVTYLQNKRAHVQYSVRHAFPKIYPRTAVDRVTCSPFVDYQLLCDKFLTRILHLYNRNCKSKHVILCLFTCSNDILIDLYFKFPFCTRHLELRTSSDVNGSKPRLRDLSEILVFSREAVSCVFGLLSGKMSKLPFILHQITKIEV